jgi:hypothetical protein
MAAEWALIYAYFCGQIGENALSEALNKITGTGDIDIAIAKLDKRDQLFYEQILYTLTRLNVSYTNNTYVRLKFITNAHITTYLIQEAINNDCVDLLEIIIANDPDIIFTPDFIAFIYNCICLSKYHLFERIFPLLNAKIQFIMIIEHLRNILMNGDAVRILEFMAKLSPKIFYEFWCIDIRTIMDEIFPIREYSPYWDVLLKLLKRYFRRWDVHYIPNIMRNAYGETMIDLLMSIGVCGKKTINVIYGGSHPNSILRAKYNDIEYLNMLICYNEKGAAQFKEFVKMRKFVQQIWRIWRLTRNSPLTRTIFCEICRALPQFHIFEDYMKQAIHEADILIAELREELLDSANMHEEDCIELEERIQNPYYKTDWHCAIWGFMLSLKLDEWVN